jgi:hypothetical protein
MIRIETDEDARQYELLVARNTESGAALWRYGAAMYFYARGQMTADVLEVYRICAPIDSEDPRQLLASRGLSQAIQRITTA